LDSGVFSKVNALEALPRTWEERARKAWEYYLEEPLVKNCVNSWRSFAVGDDVKIACDDDDVKAEAVDAADRLGLMDFVKDMVLQLLVKGDPVGFKRYAKEGKDLQEIVCVNPVSVKVKYSRALTEISIPRTVRHGEGLALGRTGPPPRRRRLLPRATPSCCRVPSIELLRYRRAEQAIEALGHAVPQRRRRSARRWSCPTSACSKVSDMINKMIQRGLRRLP
jgi:hypothetical protein